jgi:hypothetical protein
MKRAQATADASRGAIVPIRYSGPRPGDAEVAAEKARKRQQ